MESRQAKMSKNACLKGKSGFQASKRGGKCLPVREKWVSSKQKCRKMLACEANMKTRQTKVKYLLACKTKMKSEQAGISMPCNIIHQVRAEGYGYVIIKAASHILVPLDDSSIPKAAFCIHRFSLQFWLRILRRRKISVNP